MQEETRDIIVLNAEKKQTDADVVRHLATLLDHYETGEPRSFYVGRHDEDLNRFSDLIGQSTFDASLVIGFHYASADGYIVQQTDLGWSGPDTLHQVLSRIGDLGMTEEFNNDFTVRLLLSLDDETVVGYEHRSSEVPMVCDDCSLLPEYDQIDGESRHYSCEHCNSEFENSYGASIVKQPTRDQFDAFFAWGTFLA